MSEQQGLRPGAIDVTPLFSTPIARSLMADAAALNAQLRETIMAREKSHPTTQHSNLGGYQSSWDMEEWGGPALTKMLNQARTIATRLTSDRHGRPVTIPWKTNCWANINRSGHGNEFHAHPGSFWSGTYYVDDGGITKNPALGGELEFLDPRGIGPAMYAPNLAFAIPGGRSIGTGETVPPLAGMLILFPAWVYHQVRPYRGNATRISVAFNFSV